MSNPMSVQTFEILGLIIPENFLMSYILVTDGNRKKLEKDGKINQSKNLITVSCFSFTKHVQPSVSVYKI